jgi:hypothetical protein
MKVKYLVFNPYTLQYSLSMHFNNDSYLHMNISSDAAEEMKKRNAIAREPKNGTGDYDKHCLYWPVVDYVDKG